ncbi:MAG: exodeoxyribonuclease VII large subunit [Clostridiales bacterium]|nr:exodeoxyribonuclease VII large subunit [Clostridiales bacterium]
MKNAGNVTLTVTELNEIINRIFKSEEMLHDIFIVGEISGINISGAHAYFTLKDESSQLSCCCFSYRKTYVPKNGEAVIVQGSPDYYVKGGRLSFNVGGIEPYGQGLLYKKIEELKEKLSRAGVFDADNKIPVPRYADNVCIVTSKSGAVIRDIITTVRKKNKGLNITVCDVRVQGDRAADDIARALKNVDKLGFDIVVVARGGGSLEDLMPFYSEEVATAVFNMKTPVISAVGHETDFSICDMAADLRMPTPTAAAEYIAFDEQALKDVIIAFIRRQKQLVSNNYEYKKIRLVSALKSLSADAGKLTSNKLMLLKASVSALVGNAAALLAYKRSLFEKAAIALDKSSPLKRLESGYFKIEKQGLPQVGVSGMKDGDRITIFGADGTAGAVVCGGAEKL